MGEAADGERALDALREALRACAPYETTLIGRRMVGMDGETLGRRIKEDARFKETPTLDHDHLPGLARRRQAA